MSNVTPNILTDYKYNMSLLFSDAAVETPHYWLADFNAKLGYFPIATALTLLGVVLFFIMKNRPDTSDIESAAYAGIMCSFIGLLLFIIEGVNGMKLLSWSAYSPIIVLTSIFILLHVGSKRF